MMQHNDIEGEAIQLLQYNVKDFVYFDLVISCWYLLNIQSSVASVINTIQGVEGGLNSQTLNRNLKVP